MMIILISLAWIQGSESDGPIRRIHGYGYGTLKVLGGYGVSISWIRQSVAWNGDDDVLDILGLDSRFNVKKVSCGSKYRYGSSGVGKIELFYRVLEVVFWVKKCFSAPVSAGSESDGPIRRIHGYGFGVLKVLGGYGDLRWNILTWEAVIRFVDIVRLSSGMKRGPECTRGSMFL
ncbi:hypothetical protein Tco_1116613 [Tanacetum coccineum]